MTASQPRAQKYTSGDDITAALARYPDSESVLGTGDDYLIACWFRGESDRLARILHARSENKVVEFHPVLVGEGYRFDPDDILEKAKGNEFTTVAVIAEMPDGSLWVSGSANAGEALILMEKAKRQICFGE